MAGEHPGGRPVSDVPRADFLAYMNAAFKMHFCFNLPNRTALKKLSRIERLRRLVDAYNMSRKKKGSEARAEFEAFMSYTEILDALSENGKAEVYVTSLRSCLRRCFFLTSQHYMGIGPAMIRPGDVVCVLFGGNAPFILRQNGQFYELVGPAYFHGFMKGEAIEAVESGRLSRTWFHLQ
ncbi:hypothetical protein GQ44DRAFT_719686 [Phaeosphaeriaceae sp. PMI808]|nr:hypothetical protein GQ44DRAFT_719686 [Phaeosphaeriaceae sp. PMI808]